MHASDTLRRIVEALLITQAETKLNSIGHLERILNKNTENVFEETSFDHDWCRHLIRRSA